ncbi:serine/threonine-protein kinase haspin homolog, partial [Hibiscus syriacus]|uniref:serine/threonine-protein kinase haspin homolog n=1 Tax=Hibiscus syriacus TaxID=106335 RepID=UPI001923F775
CVLIFIKRNRQIFSQENISNYYAVLTDSLFSLTICRFICKRFEYKNEYFLEVDAFELLEESPSPKHFGTWATGNQTVPYSIPHISSRLEKWLLSKKINFSCGPSSTFSKILETPAAPIDDIYTDDMDFSIVKTPEKCSPISISDGDQVCEDISASDGDQGCEDINASIGKFSLASTTTSSHLDRIDPFTGLLGICEQSAPLQFLDFFSKYCAPESIAKVGEGTYGEAFRAGNRVCKIVPFDGDFPVNGEVQKKSEELLEEAVLSKALNSLREIEKDDFNACTTFIETIDLKVCQGLYDAALVRAWEKWDEKNGSENDHPKEFPEKQRYLVFVLQHGGKDLESFVIENFDEARSLLVQVTAALAVAEAAYEFEHRDLHWGNILLSRKDSVTMKFMLEGKQISFRTYGISVSIIDFTLSRLNTGEKKILFLDLSQDPYLFKGPKGDKQSETYRKMKEVTEDHWEGSFPRTNVLWLIYLVDILQLKKTYVRSSKNERDMRSLKKRLDKYDSAKEAIFDSFFGDLLVDN